MNINKTQLIRLAGEGAYQRGVTVYKNGVVLSIKEKAGYIFAQVEGNEIYQVKLQITDKMLDGSCDCPASENYDFCKHCVATALAYKDKQVEDAELNKNEPLERITDHIKQLPEQAAKDALIQLIADDDLLINKWLLIADNASGTIDIKQLKKQITKALPYRSLWEYSKVRAYFANAEAVLAPIFNIFAELEAEQVFSLTQYMSQRLNKLLEQLDDSGGYRFGLESQINNTLTNTFKQLPWSANQKAQFLLQALTNEDFDMVYPEIPGDFLDSTTQDVNKVFYQAIQERWDALPDLHYGASYQEKSSYNRLLYVLLHQAEMEQDSAKKIALKAKIATEVRDFIELAELNLAQKLTAENIAQAGSWLTKAQQHQDKFRHATEIKRLKITLLEVKEQPQDALALQWQIFSKTEQISDYQKLQSLAEQSGVDKAECYRQAESVLIKNIADQQNNRWHTPGYNLLEFYLKNEEIGKAAEYAKNSKVDTGQLLQIARKTIQFDTELAFEFYQRIAMFYPQQTNNTAYQQTIDALIELRQGLADQNNWHERFEMLLGEIKQTYKAKRNLMKLLAQNFG